MEPQLVLGGSAVVIAAHQLNPSIFNPLWLVKHGIMGEDEFVAGNIFTDDVSQVHTPEFQLTILPPQLQLAPVAPRPNNFSPLRDRLIRLVKALPETPYSALGLNFIWHRNVRDIHSDTKAMFFNSSSPLTDHFDVPDAQFGAYLSKNWHEFRLKVDIKPIFIPVVSTSGARMENRIQLAFNFHRDLDTANKPESIAQLLMRWEEAIDYSEVLAKLIGKGV